MAVYQILEGIMQERDLSIADIARICNLPDSTVRGIVRRKQETIALEVAFKISSGLDISLERLNGMPERPSKKAPSCSDEAIKLARDYDGLDEHGQRIVRMVADEEKARIAVELKVQREKLEAAEEIAPEQEEPIPVTEDGLDDREKQLIGYVRRLNPGQREMFLDQTQRMIEPQKASLSVSSPQETGEKFQ